MIQPGLSTVQNTRPDNMPQSYVHTHLNLSTFKLWYGGKIPSTLKAMEKMRASAVFFYRHHFVRYLFVGGSTFVLDFTILAGLHSGLGVGLAVATTVAYWVSIAYNFIFNRYWTFDAREKNSLRRHIALYLVLLCINYVFVVIFIAFAS